MSINRLEIINGIALLWQGHYSNSLRVSKKNSEVATPQPGCVIPRNTSYIMSVYDLPIRPQGRILVEASASEVGCTRSGNSINHV